MTPYNGLFWSSVTRALLALRRDKMLANEHDITVLALIGKIETADLPQEKLAHALMTLAPESAFPVIGQSLLSYFDFNMMGNLPCYLSAVENIREALDQILRFKDQLWGSGRNYRFVVSKEMVHCEWRSVGHEILMQFELLYLLALCRHLAGRKFDFSEVLFPNGEPLLIQPVSKAAIGESDKASIRFATKWLSVHSFFHSHTVKSMLKNALSKRFEAPLEEKLLALFQHHPHPAKLRVDNVAQQLSMSESLFRRELRDNRIPFGQLLRTFIHEKAVRALLTGCSVDELAEDLGFADRRSFDRSFKEVTGVNAGQLRLLGNRMRFQRGNTTLLDTVENLPPLPRTLQDILALKDDQLNVANLATKIRQDPLFNAHVMGKANKAVFGAAPSNLEQAIGRNLGVNAVQELAITFAAQQALSDQSRFENVQGLTDAMLLSRTLIDVLTHGQDDEKPVLTQLAMFGLLSLLVIFHKDCLLSERSIEIWRANKDIAAFHKALKKDVGLCPYGASSLMLLRWGLPKSLTRVLWEVNQGVSEAAKLIRTCNYVAFDYIFNGEERAKLTLAQSPISAPQADAIRLKLGFNH